MMHKIKNYIPSYWQLAIIFSLIKLLIHFITNTNYELHRDAYLYYAMSEHLSWGYHAVPPFIALIGKISTVLFGQSVFGLRFFPAVIGAANLIVIAYIIKLLDGKKLALTLASLAFILSPVFLHVNTLFQPVAFNQFFWLFASYLILRLIKEQNPKIWIWLALLFAVAFYNKYSIVFLIIGFSVALAFSIHRKIYLSKYFLYAIGLGLLLILPNLLWQYNNNFPVLMHMQELKETQLVHVNRVDFFKNQFLMHVQAIVLWMTALFVLLFYKKEKTYRLFALLFIIVIALIVIGSGKSYYTMGVYPIMFVLGAYLIEKYIKRGVLLIGAILIIHMCVSLYVSFWFDGIPLRTAEQTFKENSFTWEDGQQHNLSQDMADMTGWKELAQSVINIYNNLDDTDKANCEIFCQHYGQAGSIMFYGKEHNLPQPASFNDSFIFWSPKEITTKNVIVVIHEWESYEESERDIDLFFESWELKTVIKNDYFRENGTRIYLAKYPEKGFSDYYRNKRNKIISGYH